MITVSQNLQNAQTGNANGTSFSCSGYQVVSFAVVTSTFTGTVNFEASNDGTNWFAIPCMNAAGSYVSTATANGMFHFGFLGAVKAVRARTSGVSAGNVTVDVTAF